MKIEFVEIQNIKSFHEPTRIEFLPGTNILIGPNGSGKSNTLDIIYAALRTFSPVWVETVDWSSGAARIEQAPFKTPLANLLPRANAVSPKPQSVKIGIRITESDLDFIEVVSSHHGQVAQILKDLAHPHPTWRAIQQNELDLLRASPTIELSLVDCQPQNIFDGNNPHDIRRLAVTSILQGHGQVAIIANELGIAPPGPNVWYLTSSRSSVTSHFSVDLNREGGGMPLQSLPEMLGQALSASSRVSAPVLPTVLRKIAIDFRQMMSDEGRNTWSVISKQPKMEAISRGLALFGFQWRLVEQPRGTNRFAPQFSRHGREIPLEQCSSGEVNLIELIFTIYGLGLKESLVLYDEPELHLHPSSQRAVFRLLDQLQEDSGCQFIVATHSPSAVTPKNIQAVLQLSSHNGKTEISSRHRPSQLETRQLLQFVHPTNSERIFFADLVVLVEGLADRFVFDRLFSDALTGRVPAELARRLKFQDHFQLEVVEVIGKGNLQPFGRLLDGLGIPFMTIADRDFLIDLRPDEAAILFTADNRKAIRVLKDASSRDGYSLFSAIESATSDADLATIKQIYQTIRDRKRVFRFNLNVPEQQKYQQILTELRKERIFVLSQGDIGAYLPINDKDIAAVLDLVEYDKPSINNSLYQRLLHTSELLDIVYSILDTRTVSRLVDSNDQIT